MKIQLTSLLVLLVAVGTISTFAQAQEKPKEETKQERIKTEFQDLNANGIDDKKESQNESDGKKKKGRRVKFVDTDGDGICDGRASGAGLKLRTRGNNAGKHSQKGKK